MAKEKIPHKKVRRYKLEKYTGRNSRHTCPSCGTSHAFARYVDVTTGEYLADDIGRCNREERCGYEKSPDDFKGQELFVSASTVKKEYLDNEFTHTIDSKYVVKAMEVGENNFLKYLRKYFDPILVDQVARKYMIGSDDLWEGATVFWQIDSEWDVRTGKIMLYNPETLKRVKEPYNHISWVHNPDKSNKFGANEDYSLTQCFFGEHLLNQEEFTTFGVVESEKTAILCALSNPKIGWIATGGVQNINETRLAPFKDKELVFYPDKGKAYKIWEDKLKPFMKDYDIKISKSVEKIEELKEGEDLGDYILLKNK